jgi:putative two-component system response regulator
MDVNKRDDEARTILIVDDETEAASAVARYFRPDRGWRPTVAHDGAEALEQAAVTPPDVALIDIRMPGMSGMEVLKRLKEVNPRCVMVMLTAVDDAATAMEALKNGATDYVHKPVSLFDLEHTIRSAIEKEGLRFENIDYQKNLETKVAEQTKSLRSLNEALERTNLEIVSALTYAIEAKDEYTRGHSRRVTEYAMALGRVVGVNGGRLRTLEVGALLHDVGKIGVSDEILHAPRELTDAEFEMVRRHPEVGDKIVEHIPMLDDARKIIRHHHERYGGGGYPDGLVGEGIDLLARITGVADIYDALTSDRPYRAPYGADEAVAVLRDMAGSHLDPQLVALFVDRRIYLLEESDD